MYGVPEDFFQHYLCSKIIFHAHHPTVQPSFYKHIPSIHVIKKFLFGIYYLQKCFQLPP